MLVRPCPGSGSLPTWALEPPILALRGIVAHISLGRAKRHPCHFAFCSALLSCAMGTHGYNNLGNLPHGPALPLIRLFHFFYLTTCLVYIRAGLHLSKFARLKL